MFSQLRRRSPLVLVVLSLTGCPSDPAGPEVVVHDEMSFTMDGVSHVVKGSGSSWPELGSLSLEGTVWEPYLNLELWVHDYVGPGAYPLTDTTVATAQVSAGGSAFSAPDGADFPGRLVVDPNPHCFTFSGRDPFGGGDFSNRYCTLSGTFEFDAADSMGEAISVREGTFRVSVLVNP